jgi:hypothetical protein
MLQRNVAQLIARTALARPSMPPCSPPSQRGLDDPGIVLAPVIAAARDQPHAIAVALVAADQAIGPEQEQIAYPSDRRDLGV